MRAHVLLLTAAVTMAACSRNPDPEYAPDTDETPAAAPAPAAAPVDPAPPAAAAAPTPVSDEEAMRLGREVTELLFAGSFDELWPHFDENVQMQVGSAANFGQMVGQVFDQVGSETDLVEETVVHSEENPGLAVYRRRAFYGNVGMNLDLFVAVNPDGSVSGVNIRPAEE